MKTMRIAAVLAATAMSLSAAGAQERATAIFAGGCFWSVESDFDHVKGILDTTSGYIGGTIANPTYENHPGSYEAVRITYDPSKVSYDQLLDVFWHSVDPTDGGGQFCDRGSSYRTAVFAMDAGQKTAADASRKAVEADLGTVATPVLAATAFTPAEDYHQNFAQMNPDHYKRYRTGCGRTERVEAVWGAKAYRGIEEVRG